MPLTDEARQYYKQKGYLEPGLVSRGEGFSFSTFRGRILFCHGLQIDVLSRWDDAFKAKYVNKPNWARTVTAIDDMSEPGGPYPGLLGWLGFGATANPYRNVWKGSYSYVSFPVWAIALTSAALPMIWLRRRVRRRHRHRRGLCLQCGYDLRGAGERCPECGSVPAAASL
jgi:hypothetical protein